MDLLPMNTSPAADPGDNTGERRVFIVAAQPYDHILDASHFLAGPGEHRGAQQLGEMDDRPTGAAQLPSLMGSLVLLNAGD